MPARGTDVDVVVVGSGFGGSVVASTLAGAGHTVQLLERGRKHPPGSFGRTPRAVSRNLWDPSHGVYGMFDVWSFTKTDAIVSSGLGGGSLIYANVLLRKDEHWFVRRVPGEPDRPWPISREDLEEHYAAVEGVLTPELNPLDRLSAKAAFLRQAAGSLGQPWERVPLAVTFGDTPGAVFDDGSANLHGVPRLTCRGIGECDFGCNLGAKNTLDLTYLSRIDTTKAEIRAGCEVRAFRPVEGGWEVDWVVHPEHQPNRVGPRNTRTLPIHRTRARALVLSAGTLGTNFLLLRNRAALPRLSDRLGRGFSGNGDFLGMLTRTDDAMLPSDGPVIASTIRLPDFADPAGDDVGPGVYLQDGGFPALFDWVSELVPPFGIAGRVAKLVVLRLLERRTGGPPAPFGNQLARLLDDGRQSANVLPMLAMGMDDPDGTLFLKDGFLALEPGAGSAAFVARVRELMHDLGGVAGGHYLDYASALLSRSVTVHPLGGVAMADSPAEGVVDQWGEVFGYPGLYVADGSVMPGPVGPNPSLTIAAVARRTALHLAERLAS